MTLQPSQGSPRAGGKKRFVRAKVRVRSLQITSDVGWVGEHGSESQLSPVGDWS